MKIAVVLNTFPNLSDTFILNQITGLVERGYDLDIISFIKSKDAKCHPDVMKYNLMTKTKYLEMPENKLWRIIKAVILFNLYFLRDPVAILRSLNIWKYNKFAKSLRLFYFLLYFLKNDKAYDIIHCHYGIIGIHGAFIKSVGIKSKIVTTFYGFDLTELVNRNGPRLYDDLFSEGDYFIAISENFKRILVEIGCDNKKIGVNRIGIDLDKYQYREKKIYDQEKTILLTVGRLVEKKAHVYIIQAVEKIVRSGVNMHYYIVGEGGKRRELEDMVSRLKLEDKISFLGALDQNEVIEIYRKAHIFVLPSITTENGDKEGTPIVLMEAQASGLPVISAYHSGIPEVVIDNESGFLVPEKNVEILEKKLRYLIENNEQWGKMGSQGRKHIENNYDINKLIEGLIEIYQKIAGSQILK